MGYFHFNNNDEFVFGPCTSGTTCECAPNRGNLMTNYAISAAIIDEKSKRILLAKRSASTTYPLHWCTPGGMAEEGETQLETLRRELREEIKATFRDFSDVQACVYMHDIRSTRTGRIVTVVCYRVPSTALDGVPECGDKTIELRWFAADELADLQMTPADRANVDALIRAIEGSMPPA
jgi:8-oxo-dGTP diphosphatase